MDVSLWKSESPVSNTLLSWKLREEFVRIRSIHDRLSGFLKHVFCFTKLFKLYLLMKSEIFFSLTSTLKSSSKIKFSKSAQSLSNAALTLLRWETISSLWWLYELPSSHFLLLKLSSMKNPSSELFKVIFFMYLQGISSQNSPTLGCTVEPKRFWKTLN